jgi:hypothetical protein
MYIIKNANIYVYYISAFDINIIIYIDHTCTLT